MQKHYHDLDKVKEYLDYYKISTDEAIAVMQLTKQAYYRYLRRGYLPRASVLLLAQAINNKRFTIEHKEWREEIC